MGARPRVKSVATGRPGPPSPVAALVRLLFWAGSVSAALFTWAWSDVLVWQRIFESSGLQQFDAPYQAGHEAVLFGLIALGALLLLQTGARWSLAYAAAVYTLAYGGAADVLYYWLDGRRIPTALPWLDVAHPLVLFHPVTAEGLLASTAAWSALWGGIAALILCTAIRSWVSSRRAPVRPTSGQSRAAA